MFEIRNKSMKPICIGGVSLLPGEKAAVEDAFEEYVRLYEKLGYVQAERSLAGLKAPAEEMGTPGKGKNRAAPAAAEAEAAASAEASEQAAQER